MIVRGITSWSFSPYKPPLFDTGDIYISRISPDVSSVTADWLSSGDGAVYSVSIKKAEDSGIFADTTDNTTYTFVNLIPDTDYEITVSCKNKKSRTRLARTGFVPGNVVNYLHPEDKAYIYSGYSLCSPSLVRHPDGFLLSSMDVYKGGFPQNLTLIFRSDDDGVTWKYQCELFPCFWMKMFIYRNELYAMGVSTEYGDLLIGKSTDGGKSFGVPSVLLRGSGTSSHGGIHKNPVCVTEFKGRLWTALEYGSWTLGDHAVMMASASTDADLLNPASWCFTEPVPYKPECQSTVRGKTRGCIEGSAVISPDGELYNILRYNITGCEPNHGYALIMKCDTDNPEKALTFERLMEFPGNHSKFEIQFDEISGCYISIISRIRDSSCSGDRNLLSLAASKDLVKWTVVEDLLDYTHLDPKFTGFQYISYIIENDDILYLSRTAFNKAVNFHDANYQTFHRCESFRDKIKLSGI